MTESQLTWRGRVPVDSATMDHLNKIGDPVERLREAARIADDNDVDCERVQARIDVRRRVTALLHMHPAFAETRKWSKNRLSREFVVDARIIDSDVDLIGPFPDHVTGWAEADRWLQVRNRALVSLRFVHGWPKVYCARLVEVPLRVVEGLFAAANRSTPLSELERYFSTKDPKTGKRALHHDEMPTIRASLFGDPSWLAPTWKKGGAKEQEDRAERSADKILALLGPAESNDDTAEVEKQVAAVEKEARAILGRLVLSDEGLCEDLATRGAAELLRIEKSALNRGVAAQKEYMRHSSIAATAVSVRNPLIIQMTRGTGAMSNSQLGKLCGLSAARIAQIRNDSTNSAKKGRRSRRTAA